MFFFFFYESSVFKLDLKLDLWNRIILCKKVFFFKDETLISHSFCDLKSEHLQTKLYSVIFIQETEVKNEVQDCPENDSVPGGELYIDENAEEKEQEYPDSMEKADYGSLYASNQYYNRYYI